MTTPRRVLVCTCSVKECLYRHRNTRFSSNPTLAKKTTSHEVHNRSQQDVVETPSSAPRERPHRRLSIREDDDSDDEERHVGRQRGKTDRNKSRKWADRLAETAYTDYKTVEPDGDASGMTATSIHVTTTKCADNGRQTAVNSAIRSGQVGLPVRDVGREPASDDDGLRVAPAPRKDPVAVASVTATPSRDHASQARSKSVAPSSERLSKHDRPRPVKSAVDRTFEYTPSNVAQAWSTSREEVKPGQAVYSTVHYNSALHT